MPKITLQTTQNVSIDMDAGQVGDRFVAALLDYFVLGIYSWVCTLILDEMGFAYKGWAFAIFLRFPIWIYQIPFEYFSNGQTIGKKIMKIKVIKTDGSRASIGDIILRWMFYPTTLGYLLVMFFNDFMQDAMGDWFALLFFVFFAWIVGEMIFVGVNKQGQRVGDFIAGTTVIRLKKRAGMEDTILKNLDTTYRPKYMEVLKFSDRDMRTIKEALEHYQKSNDPKHIRILAKKSKEILGVTEKVRPAPFLERIIRDYNFLALENDK